MNEVVSPLIAADAAPVPGTADSVLWRRLLTFEERKALLTIDPWRSV